MISGWLFDAYPSEDKMVFWIKQQNGNTIRLEDNGWSHSIYVASDDKSDLKSIVNEAQHDDNDDNDNDNVSISSLVKDYEFISRYEKITDNNKTDVLKLMLYDSTKALTLAKRINDNSKFGKFRLYNVDLLPEQSYFYERDIFPLANCRVHSSHSKLRWINKEDNVWSVDYKIPNFKTIHITINPRKEGKIPKYTDKISSISISISTTQSKDHYSFEIQSESEADIIDELVKEITKKIDPDFILTEDGDSFTLPYLIYRAEKNCIGSLFLGREQDIPLKKSAKKGISYFSYGRTYFKPTPIKLLGRIHIDTANSFIYNDSGFEGLYEISRICRMPLHTAARASIGKCLSSLQFYYATQKGILVPWKPTLGEHFKTFEELLIADRGGFIFEPEISSSFRVHEKVAEFDFVSLYPNIMLKNNLSAETISCNCCPNSTLRVPELYYNICEKRVGIVPTSLKIILIKRATYKELKKATTITNQKLKTVYDARQSVLKWILVTSFGYLGFNNAKFGRIDAHIAVCAFDRQILLRAAKVAENHGFSVLHGIVDSLWIRKKDDDDNSIMAINKIKKEEDYLKLKESIEKETGFTVSFEGLYKWITFANSKRNSESPVVNRYFGAFEDNNDYDDNDNLKVRGMEARRHDTPIFLSKFQTEILAIMAKGNNIQEVKALMPEVKDIFHKYLQLLNERKVPIEKLVFTKRLSKNSDEYQHRNTIEKNAIMQLDMEGKSLKAGQILKYIITDYYCEKQSNKIRAIPAEIIDEEKTTYDVRRYEELLVEVCNSVIEPFGCTLSDIQHQHNLLL